MISLFRWCCFRLLCAFISRFQFVLLKSTWLSIHIQLYTCKRLLVTFPFDRGMTIQIFWAMFDSDERKLWTKELETWKIATRMVFVKKVLGSSQWKPEFDPYTLSPMIMEVEKDYNWNVLKCNYYWRDPFHDYGRKCRLLQRVWILFCKKRWNLSL